MLGIAMEASIGTTQQDIAWIHVQFTLIVITRHHLHVPVPRVMLLSE
jgi:hypothetical protein